METGRSEEESRDESGDEIGCGWPRAGCTAWVERVTWARLGPQSGE